MNKRLRSIVTIVVLLVIAAAGAWFYMNRSSLPGGIVKDGGSNISDYSAVFLTNGQVYFGKIASINSTEVDLRDIFYLQVNQQQGLQPGASPSPTPASGSNAQPEISLVKLGNELHGPNDRMRINRDQVLFTESLKKDSKVVTAIEDFKE
jgi:hypothetical protein